MNPSYIYTFDFRDPDNKRDFRTYLVGTLSSAIGFALPCMALALEVHYRTESVPQAVDTGLISLILSSNFSGLMAVGIKSLIFPDKKKRD